MTSLDRALEIETHDAMMCRLGFRPENLERHERRIVELRFLREQQHQEYLEARSIEERMTAPGLREPSCVQPLGPDQYFDGRGELREQRHVEGHH